MPVCDELASRLCTACGMCCDTTLYDKGEVTEAERDELAKDNFVFEVRDGIIHFQIPCGALCENRCAVYARRPQNCRDYRCRVLTRMEAGELDFDEALAKVESAQAALEAVSGYRQPGEHFNTLNRRWLKSGKDLENRPEFHFAMLALNLILDREFRDENALSLKR